MPVWFILAGKQVCKSLPAYLLSAQAANAFFDCSISFI